MEDVPPQVTPGASIYSGSIHWLELPLSKGETRPIRHVHLLCQEGRTPPDTWTASLRPPAAPLLPTPLRLKRWLQGQTRPARPPEALKAGGIERWPNKPPNHPNPNKAAPKRVFGPFPNRARPSPSERPAPPSPHPSALHARAAAPTRRQAPGHQRPPVRLARVHKTT